MSDLLHQSRGTMEGVGDAGEQHESPLTWDRGALKVNPAFQDRLEALGLTTVEAFLKLSGSVVREIDSRVTRRIDLGSLVIYLKQHGTPHWRELLVPLLRFSKPTLGAEPEWSAIIEFHRLSIPTVEPVAFGVHRHGSFLATQDLSAKCDLKSWVRECRTRIQHDGNWRPCDAAQAMRFTERLAVIVARMHRHGFHHQDLYLNHVLWLPGKPEGSPDLRIIDLGRVASARLFRRRWILKDLAQLHYSAIGVPGTLQMRFLRLYLGRRLQRSDRRWIRWILWKSNRIARHTVKHAL
jgi:Lipopolysaccharide kinase (Kdo/WaaP) family